MKVYIPSSKEEPKNKVDEFPIPEDMSEEEEEEIRGLPPEIFKDPLNSTFLNQLERPKAESGSVILDSKITDDLTQDNFEGLIKAKLLDLDLEFIVNDNYVLFQIRSYQQIDDLSNKFLNSKCFGLGDLIIDQYGQILKRVGEDVDVKWLEADWAP